MLQRDEAQRIEVELEGLKKVATTRKKRIESLKADIHKLEDNIANPPEVEDPDAIKADEVSRCRICLPGYC